MIATYRHFGGSGFGELGRTMAHAAVWSWVGSVMRSVPGVVGLVLVVVAGLFIVRGRFR